MLTSHVSIPVKHGVLDWDCAEALVIPDIESSLRYIQLHGILPVSTTLSFCPNPFLNSAQPGFDSKEDRNSIGSCPVRESVIDELKAQVFKWMQPGNPGHGILNSTPSPLRICIFDGFLLYSQSMAEIQSHMDIKLFLQVSFSKAKMRREARDRYATIEGFWQDPPGYVEKIVWPNYVEDHKWMFENGDVEGTLKDDVTKEWKIESQGKGPDVDMEITLRWTVERLVAKLEEISAMTES
jgi:nicotinamide/nicotinate riboside kinase